MLPNLADCRSAPAERRFLFRRRCPRTAFPDITADPNGAVYLTFRTPDGRSRRPRTPPGNSRSPTSTAPNGKRPIVVPNSDNLPRCARPHSSRSRQTSWMISATDHRYSFAAGPAGGGGFQKEKEEPSGEAEGQAAAKAQKAAPTGAMQQVGLNTDLYAAEFRFGSPASARTRPAAAEQPAGDADVRSEREQIGSMRSYRVSLGSDKMQIMRGEFHRHTEISGDGGNDGPLVDAYRYPTSMPPIWIGPVAATMTTAESAATIFWWVIQKMTDAYHLGNRYVPMSAYERSVVYSRRAPQRGLPPPRHPPASPDSPLTDPRSAQYARPTPRCSIVGLKQFGGIVASHTSGTNMGTDWRDNDPFVEPVVEIYQGDRQNYEIPNGPPAPTPPKRRPPSVAGIAARLRLLWRSKRLPPRLLQASSDHISTHMSYCNLWVTSPTREGIMEAFHKRRVYGATDNILADVRQFRLAHPPPLHGRGVRSTRPPPFRSSSGARPISPRSTSSATANTSTPSSPAKEQWTSTGRTPPPRRARPATTTSAASRPTAN